MSKVWDHVSTRVKKEYPETRYCKELIVKRLNHVRSSTTCVDQHDERSGRGAMSHSDRTLYPCNICNSYYNVSSFIHVMPRKAPKFCKIGFQYYVCAACRDYFSFVVSREWITLELTLKEYHFPRDIIEMIKVECYQY